MEGLTYLAMELGWALPVIGGQWILGWRRLASRLPLLLGVLAVATVWLCVADTVAIGYGIWRLSPTKTTGLTIGILPLEEAVFFLVTNAMVIQGLLITFPDTDDSGRESSRTSAST